MFRSREGQSLVEAIVAIGISVVIITGLVVLAVGAVRTATLSRNRAIAVQYAQEGIEALRSIRDRDFAVLGSLASNTNYQLVPPGSQWNVAPGTRNITVSGVVFQQKFVKSTAAPASASKPRFTVTVSWTDSAGSHTADLVTYLSDWR